MEDFSNLYSYDFKDYAVNHLKSLGYLVNQSIIVTCMGTGTEYDRSAQLDSVVYDLRYAVLIEGYCLSLANGIRLEKLERGYQSSRNVLDVYNLLKPYEDKSEKTRQGYRQYLEAMRYNRAGIYGRIWPNIENMLY